VSRASLASTSIDRTDEYLAKPEHKKRPDYYRQVLRGVALKDEMSRRWAKRAERTNPDVATENRA
jgi:hypothetical protein